MDKAKLNCAIVTGAYGGMGKEVCKLLASQGYTVFALDKKVDKATENIIPIEVDVTDNNSILNAFEEVNKQCSELSI